jgi:hypothetical protein
MDPPPPKKAKISSERMVSTRIEVPISTEEAPIVPPMPKRRLRKQKEHVLPTVPSADAPISSSSKGHVSAVISFRFSS